MWLNKSILKLTHGNEIKSRKEKIGQVNAHVSEFYLLKQTEYHETTEE